ncbi:unnamed protein product, partial [marine sediment metagenome]
IDGLLHVSDMSWTKKINHPSEMVKKGDMIDCVVLKVEQGKQRIALGIKQLQEDPWARAVLENYIPGQIVEGTVTKITNFGVFVQLEEDLEGLLHVSELADHKVEDPHQEVKIADKILVKILRVDPVERKIGLSKKRAEWSIEQDEESEKKFKPRRGGLHGPGEETTDLIDRLPVISPPLKKADSDPSDDSSEKAASEPSDDSPEKADSDPSDDSSEKAGGDDIAEGGAEEASGAEDT